MTQNRKDGCAWAIPHVQARTDPVPSPCPSERAFSGSRLTLSPANCFHREPTTVSRLSPETRLSTATRQRRVVSSCRKLGVCCPSDEGPKDSPGLPDLLTQLGVFSLGEIDMPGQTVERRSSTAPVVVCCPPRSRLPSLIEHRPLPPPPVLSTTLAGHSYFSLTGFPYPLIRALRCMPTACTRSCSTTFYPRAKTSQPDGHGPSVTAADRNSYDSHRQSSLDSLVVDRQQKVWSRSHRSLVIWCFENARHPPHSNRILCNAEVSVVTGTVVILPVGRISSV